MTDVYNMKSVFSCSDFLTDLWQGGSDGIEALAGLACPASEGGSTQLGREGSSDILHLLNQAEEANSSSRTLAHLTASSSNKQESAEAQAMTGEPVDSSLLHSNLSAPHSLLPQPFYPQPASTSFPQFEAQPAQLPTVPNTLIGQGSFHMDPVKQAKAICNHGVSVTALQQQLAELKGKACGLESILRTGMHSGASPCFPELAPTKAHAPSTAGAMEALAQAAAPQLPVAPSPQSQLGLQEYQLRQLAALLGSTNMAALQNMTIPPSAPQCMPGSSIRELGHSSHSSGDDDTGELPELQTLTSLADSLLEEGEHSWEAKLDKNLPPPEMKRMRRMLSNRESARRSRRRKQAHMQDLEVQNNELVEANEKLQKEMGLLRIVAKEALLEKKKSQSALESLKHQVVHLLGEHNILPKQGTLKQDPAVTAGTDSDASGSGHLAILGAVPAIPGNAPCSEAAANCPQGVVDKSKQTVTQKIARSPKAPISPRSGSKRKASEV